MSVTSTAHGLSSGDYIVVRGGADDYRYVTISNVTSNAFDYVSATSGTASGTDGAYIPAFDITGFAADGFTVNPPSTGDCQLLSMKYYLVASEDSPVNVVINGDRENGAGENDATDTRIPPLIKWFDASGGTAAQSDLSKVTFSTTGTYSTYVISGGSVGDTGGEAICVFHF